MTLYSIIETTGARLFYASLAVARNAWKLNLHPDACGMDRHEVQLTKYLLLQLLNAKWPVERFLKEAKTSVIEEVPQVIHTEQPNEVEE